LVAAHAVRKSAKKPRSIASTRRSARFPAGAAAASLRSQVVALAD
jgi:hypothetical protein